MALSLAVFAAPAYAQTEDPTAPTEPAQEQDAPQQDASRWSVRVNEEAFLPLSGLDTFVVVDPAVADVRAAAGGLRAKGIRTGDTIIQVYATSGPRVVVLRVLSPAPAPPPPPGQERLPRGGGGIKSAWGFNTYTGTFMSDSRQSAYLLNTLLLRGRFRDGLYQTDAYFTLGQDRDRLHRLALTWESDDRARRYVLGDTATATAGPTALAMVAMRGLTLRHTVQRASQEAFVGFLRSPASNDYELDRPVAGATIRGERPLGAVRAQAEASVVGFDHAPQLLASDQSGVNLAGTGRVVHRAGLSFDARVLSSLVAPTASEPAHQGLAASASGEYRTLRDYDRVDFERQGAGMVSLGGATNRLAYQRAGAFASRRFESMQAGLGGSYSVTEDGAGTDHASYALTGAFGKATSATTRLASTVGYNVNAVPVVLQGVAHDTSQTLVRAGLGVDHDFDILTTGHGEVAYMDAQAPGTRMRAASALASVQRARSGPWDWSASTTATFTKTEQRDVTSELAVDQSSFETRLGAQANGRFVQGPYQAFGGFGLQALVMPKTELQPTVNLGMELTPTPAHKLSGNLAVFKTPGTRGEWVERVLVTYTHHFGNDVHTRPLFDFVDYGTVEGRLCVDGNWDGKCAADEKPITGVEVRLDDGRRARSGSDGRFLFTGVRPGEYRVDVDDTMLRKLGRPTTGTVVLGNLRESGRERIDFGVIDACEMSGRIYNDLNGNGRRDESEPLYAFGHVLAEGPGGHFQARVLPNGTWHMQVTTCGEYTLSLDPGSLPASVGVVGDNRAVVNAVGNDIALAELGVFALRSISGEAYEDANGNGRRDDGERALAHVKLFWADGSVETDDDGAFLIRRLPPGTYELLIEASTLPKGLISGAPVSVVLPLEPTMREDVRVPAVRAP